MHQMPFAVAVALFSASCLAAEAPGAAAAGSIAPAPASAASAALSPAAAPSASAGERLEPAVRQSVVEDDATRIDELRVRGQLQRIVVTSKGSLRSYEILTGDGSRDLADTGTGSRGATGKRVWNVFKF